MNDDFILKNLRTACGVRKWDKLSIGTDDSLRIDPPRLWRPVMRKLRGDSGILSIYRLDNILQQALSIVWHKDQYGFSENLTREIQDMIQPLYGVLFTLALTYQHSTSILKKLTEMRRDLRRLCVAYVKQQREMARRREHDQNRDQIEDQNQDQIQDQADTNLRDFLLKDTKTLTEPAEVSCRVCSL